MIHLDEPLVLVQNDHITIVFHPKEKVLEYTPKGFIASAKLHQLHRDLLELYAKHRAEKTLGNFLHSEAVGVADQEWIVENFVKPLHKLGVRYNAAVRAKTVFGSATGSAILKKAQEQGLFANHRGFETRDEAFQWLAGVK